MCIILFFEKAFVATTEGLRPATRVRSLPEHRVEVGISLRKLGIALLHMLMSGEIEPPKVRPHVIQLSSWLLAPHCKSVLKRVAADTRIDRVSSLKDWLLLLLYASIIAACGRSGVIVGLLSWLLSHCTGNACNLRLEIFIKLAQDRFSIEGIINGYSKE